MEFHPSTRVQPPPRTPLGPLERSQLLEIQQLFRPNRNRLGKRAAGLQPRFLIHPMIRARLGLVVASRWSVYPADQIQVTD